MGLRALTYFFKTLIVYGCPWSSCCMRAFSSCCEWASPCSGCFYCGAQTLGAWVSLVVACSQDTVCRECREAEGGREGNWTSHRMLSESLELVFFKYQKVNQPQLTTELTSTCSNLVHDFRKRKSGIMNPWERMHI